MTLPDLLSQLVDLSVKVRDPDKGLILGLVAHVREWVDGDQSVRDLAPSIDRYIGYVWFSTNELHSAILALVSQFSAEISGINGMTVNERLFALGLMRRYDSASSDAERQTIRSKIDA